jgi:hypothetical protein
MTDHVRPLPFPVTDEMDRKEAIRQLRACIKALRDLRCYSREMSWARTRGGHRDRFMDSFHGFGPARAVFDRLEAEGVDVFALDAPTVPPPIWARRDETASAQGGPK